MTKITVFVTLLVLLGAVSCEKDRGEHRRLTEIEQAIKTRDVERVRTSFTAAERVNALGTHVRSGDVEGVKVLLAAGADAESGMDDAVTLDHPEIVKSLLDAGANPPDSSLLFAAGPAALAMLLDRAGSRIAQSERDDALFTVARLGEAAKVTVLLQHGADPTSLHDAVVDTNGTKTLVRQTPAEAARAGQHYEVVELLNAAVKNRQVTK